MDIPKTGIPDGANEQAPHTFNIGMRRDGGGDADDAMASMKQFMHPGGGKAEYVGSGEPVNQNPFHSTGSPNLAEFGAIGGQPKGK